MSPLLAAAYDRTLMPEWVRAAQACDAVCILLRIYGTIGLRDVGRRLHSLDVGQDAAEALDLLGDIEGRSWELRSRTERTAVEEACRAARVELLAAGESSASRWPTLRPEPMADTERAPAGSL